MMLSLDVFKEAAEELGIVVEQLADTPIHRFTHNKKTILVDKSHTTALGTIGFVSCNEKHITKRLLRAANINTPRWEEFYKGSTTEDIAKYCKNLTFPVVVKPFKGSHGADITVGISNVETTIPAVQQLQPDYDIVVVEEFFTGSEVRLIATREQFLAGTLRRPASILADGKHTVRELVDLANADPRRHTDNTDKVLRQLKLDDLELSILEESGYTTKSVPPDGERVYLRKVSNISAGGDSIDITDDIHPSIQKIAIAAVNSIPELPFAGIDLMTTDYTVGQTENSYTIVELNANPMLGLQRLPYEGRPRNTAVAILKEMFTM